MLIAIGFCIAAIANNINELNSYSGAIFLPLMAPFMLGMLGPKPYTQYFRVLPTYQIVESLSLSLTDSQNILPLWGILSLLAIFYMVIAAWLLRKFRKI